MNSEPGMPLQELPSKRALAKASGVAFVVAAVLLVTTVLPAEYGVDPLGTGAAMGLLAIRAPVKEESIAPPRGSTAYTPIQKGPAAFYGTDYKVDSAEFVLEPYEYVEYKYHLEKGASLLFSWSADSTVIQDFHGEADADPKKAVSFDKRDLRQATGSLIAPFTGIHGWYWENPGRGRVKIKIVSAGFYNAALEIGLNKVRKAHAVRSAGDIHSNKKLPAEVK